MIRQALRLSLIAIASSSMMAAPLSAQGLGICTLVVVTGGTMTPNASFTQLSSTNSGGSGALVTATVVGLAMTLQLTGPSNFSSAPSEGNANVSFTTEFSTTGATLIVPTANLTPRPIAVGLTTISIQLSAAKSSGVFPSGSYAADVTVNCS